MITKKILLSSVVIAALSLSATAAEVEAYEEESSLEISGYLKAEISAYTGSGTSKNAVGQSLRSPGVEHSGGDLMKTEGTLKVFINGDVGEESSFHAEVQAINDWEGIDGYESHRNNTQNDFLRELYIDTSFGGWDFRLGKQQVVWGTADGVKFLDIINPTDFREWGQNTMEDSRIPLWMAVAEKDLGNNDSLQIVWVPDVGQINQIPGLNNTETGDQGQPFVSLGADSITGQYNGFLNIGRDMGRVAGAFDFAFGTAFGAGFGNNILQGFTGLTVGAFTENVGDVSGLISSFGGDPTKIGLPASGGPSGAQLLTGVAIAPPPQGVGATTNLVSGTTQFDYQNPSHMFEYMGDTTFATFDAFIGMNTEYRITDPGHDFSDHNFGIRYKKATNSGFNYTLNYYRHWENNPFIDLQWEDSAGNELTSVGRVGNFVDPRGNAYQTTTIGLVNSSTGAAYNPSKSGPATLVFDQGVSQINTFGTSFDYALDTAFAPIVIRGEFVYDQGAKVPEVDLGKLAYGDIVNALTSVDADIVKYVIGLDVTVAKNLFVSFQFMDTWNLDYVDQNVQYAGNSKSYGKFTANPATLSLTNGFKKAEEHQIMYTLFLSKPFLESDAMRVNNLFLYEQEDGGFWNRLDLEYSYADNILLSAEWNQYGGDKNAIFGQFEDQSNFQVGVKYLF